MTKRMLGLAIALALAVGAQARASEEFSTDITVDLGGTIANDEDVVDDAGGGAPAKVDLGALPPAAAVSGYTIANNGDVLFALDIAASLAGGVDVNPRDVVRWNGSVYSIEFHGDDHGVPPGAKIDAIGLASGDLLLSFDITVTLGNVTADDEDLVRLESTQPDVWSLYFDGSAKGVPPAADLDGADVIDATGDLALSFDISGTAGGVPFDDEDILQFDPTNDTWTMTFDGSSHFAALAAADVKDLFVPEPGALAAGLVALVALAARRTRS